MRKKRRWKKRKHKSRKRKKKEKGNEVDRECFKIYNIGFKKINGKQFTTTL